MDFPLPKLFSLTDCFTDGNFGHVASCGSVPAVVTGQRVDWWTGGRHTGRDRASGQTRWRRGRLRRGPGRAGMGLSGYPPNPVTAVHSTRCRGAGLRISRARGESLSRGQTEPGPARPGPPQAGRAMAERSQRPGPPGLCPLTGSCFAARPPAPRLRGPAALRHFRFRVVRPTPPRPGPMAVAVSPLRPEEEEVTDRRCDPPHRQLQALSVETRIQAQALGTNPSGS